MLTVKMTDEGSLIISRNGDTLLEIDEFEDTSHPGHHLFLIPHNAAVISKTEKDDNDLIPWTHELLKG